jgi:hypothetical protein
MGQLFTRDRFFECGLMLVFCILECQVKKSRIVKCLDSGWRSLLEMLLTFPLYSISYYLRNTFQIFTLVVGGGFEQRHSSLH